MTATTVALPDNMTKRFEVDPDSGCWVWTQGVSSNGYGKARVGRRQPSAHTWFYETLIGPVPAGLGLDHLCHTHDPDCPGGSGCKHRRCVNPAHLEPVTQAENVRRGHHGIKRTHCRNGHALTGTNVRVRGPRRYCRACDRAKAARHAARHRRAEK
jgi:hypothetical protein